MSSGGLPSPRARAAFERTHNLGGDPTTIKATGLGLRALIAHEASIHGAGVECNEGFDGPELGGGVLVAPPHLLRRAPVHAHCPVGRIALPLAKRAPGCLPHVLHVNVLLGYVVH